MGVQTRRDISRTVKDNNNIIVIIIQHFYSAYRVPEIEVKLLSSVKRKSYVRRRLAQQRMTLSDLEWPFRLKSTSSASRTISVVAELLVVSDVVR